MLTDTILPLQPDCQRTRRMTKFEFRMPNKGTPFVIRHSSFVISSSSLLNSDLIHQFLYGNGLVLNGLLDTHSIVSPNSARHSRHLCCSTKSQISNLKSQISNLKSQGFARRTSSVKCTYMYKRRLAQAACLHFLKIRRLLVRISHGGTQAGFAPKFVSCRSPQAARSRREPCVNRYASVRC
jgi:hypothetical protein